MDSVDSVRTNRCGKPHVLHFKSLNTSWFVLFLCLTWKVYAVAWWQEHLAQLDLLETCPGHDSVVTVVVGCCCCCWLLLVVVVVVVVVGCCCCCCGSSSRDEMRKEETSKRESEEGKNGGHEANKQVR